MEPWEQSEEIADVLFVIKNRIDLIIDEEGNIVYPQTINKLERGIKRLQGFVEKLKLMEGTRK